MLWPGDASLERSDDPGVVLRQGFDRAKCGLGCPTRTTVDMSLDNPDKQLHCGVALPAACQESGGALSERLGRDPQTLPV